MEAQRDTRYDGGSARTRVLVVDDHELFRTGLRTLLEDEGFEVGDAVSGEAAVRRVRGFQPDVVVMDMNMPGMSGIEATREILRVEPRTAVLMLTIVGEEERVLEALQAGASGYLLKDTELDDIIAGIEAAARGHSAISPRVAGALVARVRRAATHARVDEEPEHAPLSAREREVLALVAEGYDNAEIGRRLYVSPSTVKNHVSSLLEKLGADNRVQVAAYAIRHGFDRDDRLR
jgi:DNA-binding NarL/FixJ family response regulator